MIQHNEYFEPDLGKLTITDTGQHNSW